MNLTFTELDDSTCYYDSILPTNNISEIQVKKLNTNEKNSQNTNNIKKPKISYQDILSSMGTVVINGKLEFVRKNNNLQQNSEFTTENTNKQQKKVIVNNLPQQINKNSYIYNKHFKNYKEPQLAQYIEEPIVPMTKKEFARQVIVNRINEINQRNRIAEIKSTKLMFNNNNNRNIIINTMQNQNTLNHLFRF
jgi:hypothetical protein